MTKRNKETPETETAEEVDPTQLPGSPEGTDLPASWEGPSEGALPALREESAPLDRSDFITPKIHLVQKTGDLSVRFPLGAWVLNKELLLTKALGDPLHIVVLERPYKFYMEHRPFDPNDTTPPKTFNSVEAVEAAGLTTEWDNVNNVRPSVDKAARVLLLIRKPEAVTSEGGFGLQIEGLGPCAVASWLLVNTAYNMAAKRIFTAEKLDLGGKPLVSLLWTLRSVPAKVGGYNIVGPQLTPEQKVTEETQEAIRTALR